MRNLLLICGMVLVAGCGSAAEEVPIVQQEYVPVIDHEGQQRIIPSGSLLDPDSGKPTVQKVLTVDRWKNQKTWVTVDELLEQPPSTARYIPLTQTDPKAIGQASVPSP